MKNQWTTVNDPVQTEMADAAQKAAEKPTPSRSNHKMALAMASVGVFLILIGAAPFLFGDKDSSDYSAFLGQEVSQNSGAQIVVDEGEQPADDAEEDMIDEPDIVEIDDPGSEDTPPAEEPAMTNEPVTPSNPSGPPVDDTTATTEPVGEENPADTTNDAPPPAPDAPIAVKVPAKPAVTPEPETEEEPEATIISELVDYPIITGSIDADPKDLARIATSEQMHSAAPEQPGTGLPALPLLAFSGAAAYFWRKKRSHR